MQKQTLPLKITVLYRPVGGAHVFTSPDIDGLHVARSELKPAYDLLLSVVAALLHRRLGGTRALYHFAKGFEAFERAIRNRNPLLPTKLVLSRVRSTAPAKRRKTRASSERIAA
jgi:hypothetical protein